MKKIFIPIAIVAMATLAITSCKDKKEETNEKKESVQVEVKDTAVYGVCGEGTTKNHIELVLDNGKTMEFEVRDESSDVQGGVFSGDKMTIVYAKTDEGNIVTKAVNLTSLLGRWTSLDKNFTIKEGGEVESNVQSESRPYTAWHAVNANIVMNADTFSVYSLGSDSLALENSTGVFVYKRQN